MYDLSLLVFYISAYKFEPYVWNKSHDISMMAYELENIAILNGKGADYRCVLWSMTSHDSTNRLNSSKLDNKGPLQIWILVEIKNLFK